MNRALPLSLLLLGCSRTFSAPVPPTPLPQGAACRDGGSACASGFCVDSVCCASGCQPTQRCNDPLQLGTCADRPIGGGCDAGEECPSGFCADHVCCREACDQPCHFCNGGVPGTCELVADNTDPRGQCPGACSACYGGVCGPAESETDPRTECDGGQLCDGSGACKSPGGSDCASDGDCAGGRCIGASCAGVDIEKVTAGVDTTSTGLEVLALDATPEEDEAVTFAQAPANSTAEIVAAFHRHGRQWLSAQLAEDTFGGPPSGALPVFLGSSLWFVVSQPGGSGSSCAPNCGVTFVPVNILSGTVGRREAIDLAARQTDATDVYVEPSGAVTVAYTTASAITVAQRAAGGDGGWSQVGSFARPGAYRAGSLGLAPSPSGPVVSWLEQRACGSSTCTSAALAAADGTRLAASGADFPCQPDEEVGLATARAATADGYWRATLECIPYADYPRLYAVLANLSASGPLMYPKLLTTPGLATYYPSWVASPRGNGHVALLEGYSPPEDVAVEGLNGTPPTRVADLPSGADALNLAAAPGPAGLLTIAVGVEPYTTESSCNQGEPGCVCDPDTGDCTLTTTTGTAEIDIVRLQP